MATFRIVDPLFNLLQKKTKTANRSLQLKNILYKYLECEKFNTVGKKDKNLHTYEFAVWDLI